MTLFKVVETFGGKACFVLFFIKEDNLLEDGEEERDRQRRKREMTVTLDE